MKTWKPAIKETQGLRDMVQEQEVQTSFLLIMGHLCFPHAISSVYLCCKLLLMGAASPKILCWLQKLLTEMPQCELLRAAKSYATGTKHLVDSPD